MKKIGKTLLKGLFSFLVIIVFISAIPPVRAEAVGWLEDATRVVANYTEYPMFNYSLDFYVSNDWNWLPWNWGEGIGNTAYYALYLITNMFWLLNVILSYFMGYILEQAYKLDFITDSVSLIARNIQTIAGVEKSGFKTIGLFPKLLPFLILFMGAYMLYVGLFKRQFTKALGQVVKFVVVGVMGLGVISYAEDYVVLVNDFQKEFNTEVMKAGQLMTVSSNEPIHDDPVVGMRATLFDVQIKQPYLLLQYGESDVDVVGEERVNNLLDVDPFENAEEREGIVSKEAENNPNMSIIMVPLRFGMVLLIFIANIVIDVSIGVFSGVMIFSQVLFILFLCFLPVAFIFALLPNKTKILSGALAKTFNAIMTKSAITILLAVVFSISNLVYSVSSKGNFFWMMFLQIVVFVISMIKMNDFFGFMGLSSSDSEGVNKHMRGVGRGFVGSAMNIAGLNRLNRTMRSKENNTTSNNTTGGKKTMFGNKARSNNSRRANMSANENTRSSMHSQKRSNSDVGSRKLNFMQKQGTNVANVLDAPNKVKSSLNNVKDSVKNTPLNTRYTAQKAKEGVKRSVVNVKDDFRSGMINKQVSANANRRKSEALRNRNLERKRLYVNPNSENKINPQKTRIVESRKNVSNVKMDKHSMSQRNVQKEHAKGTQNKMTYDRQQKINKGNARTVKYNFSNANKVKR
jgi:hypothetical protein